MRAASRPFLRSVASLLVVAAAACSGSVDPGHPGGNGADDAGPSGPVNGPFCKRWAALGAGALPGFATDSACADYSDIPTGDVPCSGAGNDGATIADVQLAQTHLLRPTSEDFTTN